MKVRHIKKSHHQGSSPSASRGTRGGRRNKSSIAPSSLEKLTDAGSSTASVDTGTVEQLQAHSALFGMKYHDLFNYVKFPYIQSYFKTAIFLNFCKILFYRLFQEIF